jgi:hypothetical protein
MKDAKSHGIPSIPLSIGSFASRNVGTVDPIAEELGGKRQRNTLSAPFSVEGCTKGNAKDTKFVALGIQTRKVVASLGFKGNFRNAAIFVEEPREIGRALVRDSIKDHVDTFKGHAISAAKFTIHMPP